METKPYSLQAPEGIAKEYGGNKQRIAQAVQMGMVDPTAALMAGMFIDRMRSAQSLEQMPNQTIAQQIMAPPPPPQNPGASGLDAINVQKGPPMGQQPGQPPMQMAEAGPSGNQTTPPPQPMPQMASGGLLSLENRAFDEHSFSGGGIVAFASAGAVPDRRARLKAILDDPRATTDQRIAANLELGAMVRGQESATPSLKDIQPTSEREFGISRRRAHSEKASPSDIATATNDYMANATSMFGGDMDGASGMPFAPPPGGAAGLSALMAAKNPDIRPASPVTTPAPPARAVVNGVPRAPRSPAGPARNNPLQQTNAVAAAPELTDAQHQEAYKLANKLPAPPGTSAEEKAARKQEDLWSMLAQIGFGTAAGTSQFALENLGKGASAAMPAMQEAIKSRRADDKEDLKQQYAFKLAEAGVSGKAFEYAMNRADSAKDLKLKIRQLDETSRHNKASESLQGRQIAASERVGNRQTDNALNIENLTADYMRRGVNPVEARAKATNDVLSARANMFGGSSAYASRLEDLASDIRRRQLINPNDPELPALRTEYRTTSDKLLKMGSPRDGGGFMPPTANTLAGAKFLGFEKP